MLLPGQDPRMRLDEQPDPEELAELLTDSYCLQAPQHLAARVERPALPEHR